MMTDLPVLNSSVNIAFLAPLSVILEDFHHDNTACSKRGIRPGASVPVGGPCLLVAIRLPPGGVELLVTIGHDITEQAAGVFL